MSQKEHTGAPQSERRQEAEEAEGWGRLTELRQNLYGTATETLTTWWGPPFEKTLAKLEPEPRQRMLEEVRQAVRQFEGPQGIVAPAELLLGVGMK